MLHMSPTISAAFFLVSVAPLDEAAVEHRHDQRKRGRVDHVHEARPLQRVDAARRLGAREPESAREGLARRVGLV
jgi:hypothetical protein